MQTHAATEEGFTLIELLVVILIIGILAAIAIPAFIGQRVKALDGNAKSNARNMVTQIEACFQSGDGFVGCSAELTSTETGLPVGTGPGQVQIVSETPTGYEIRATSEGETAGVHHTFTIIHNIGGVFAHDCTVRGKGGCPLSGAW